MILDEKTFEDLYYRYSGRLGRFAERFTSDRKASEDIVSESYICLWEKYHGRDLQHWNSLVYRIVRNKCIDWMRWRHVVGAEECRQEGGVSGEELLFSRDFLGDGADCTTMYNELASAISAIYDSLPEKCREVFRLSRTEGLKNKEIAARLGISDKAVEKHISKALRSFREGLSESGYGDAATCIMILMAIGGGCMFGN